MQELADCENTPDGLKITVEVLEEDGFGSDIFFHCLVAELEGEVRRFVLIELKPDPLPE